MSVKTIICDDNDKARYILRKYIEKLNIPEIKIIGEAYDGYALIELCQKDAPDLILLDIDMPSLSGIDTAKKIQNFLPETSFVFITAYSSFSLDAFDIHAADYIVKPVMIERLQKSISYIIDQRSKLRLDTSKKYIYFKAKYEIYSINEADIVFIERTGRSTKVHSRSMVLEVYESLDSIQSRLSSQFFFRSHNSFLININYIYKIYKRCGGVYTVSFEDYDFTASLSRRNLPYLEVKAKIDIIYKPNTT